GYLWNLAVHSSLEKNLKFGANLDCNGLSFSEKVVVELSQNLLNLGYHIFLDSWFSSNRLALWLLERSTLVTGTPTSSRFARNSNVLACKFVDKKQSGTKIVYVIDTSGQAGCVNVTRIRRGGVEEVIPKPVCIANYSPFMGGVDRLDSGLQPYHPNRKTQKWFQKLGFHIILLLVRNVWIVYQNAGGTKSFLSFLEVAIKNLIEQSGPGRRCVSVRVGRAPAAAGHIPSKSGQVVGQNRPRRRCRQCQKKIVYVCSQCPGVPSLCFVNCFGTWHNN
uniref:DDE_Tnp_1_7 domain-containing protein n=1 Tax=Macrostomum lignano TaxID=282301 RepID=A0A1I8GX04_9PLAT